MATRRTDPSTSTGLQRGSAASRDRVDRTVHNLTVWGGIGAVVASGAFVAFLVPGAASSAAAPVTQQAQQSQGDDSSQQSTTTSTGGGFAQSGGGGYTAPVTTSGAS